MAKFRGRYLLLGTGTANKLPTMSQANKNPIVAERTTTSHCPLCMIGLNILVKGALNGGTALIFLNLSLTFRSFEINPVPSADC